LVEADLQEGQPGHNGIGLQFTASEFVELTGLRPSTEVRSLACPPSLPARWPNRRDVRRPVYVYALAATPIASCRRTGSGRRRKTWKYPRSVRSVGGASSPRVPCSPGQRLQFTPPPVIMWSVHAYDMLQDLYRSRGLRPRPCWRLPHFSAIDPKSLRLRSVERSQARISRGRRILIDLPMIWMQQKRSRSPVRTHMPFLPP
jgi:hypothetical protein